MESALTTKKKYKSLLEAWKIKLNNDFLYENADCFFNEQYLS
jgi:hypothetical protein